LFLEENTYVEQNNVQKQTNITPAGVFGSILTISNPTKTENGYKIQEFLGNYCVPVHIFVLSGHFVIDCSTIHLKLEIHFYKWITEIDT
jgi:hypothetical protein